MIDAEAQRRRNARVLNLYLGLVSELVPVPALVPIPFEPENIRATVMWKTLSILKTERPEAFIAERLCQRD